MPHRGRLQTNGTTMEFVPGVKQKLLLSRVPQALNPLQGVAHDLPLQNATSAVAIRQFVFGALRQVAPPLYTVQFPPHWFPERVEQYTTMTLPPMSAEGPLTKVTLASVVESQVRMSDADAVVDPSAVAGSWFEKSELWTTIISALARQQDTHRCRTGEGRRGKHGEGGRRGDESDELRGESHCMQRGGGMVKD